MSGYLAFVKKELDVYKRQEYHKAVRLQYHVDFLKNLRPVSSQPKYFRQSIRRFQRVSADLKNCLLYTSNM